MSLLGKAKSLLRTYRIVPNRLMGQNFMVEPSIFETLGKHASLDQDDVVMDIGAGLGFLTRFLASKCQTVVAVEADLKLFEVLREQLRDVSNIEVFKGNVLKVHLPTFNKTVSIPPYQISSHLLEWLFKKQLDCAVLILQKEFAKRLVAPVGSEDYGWLTVLAYYRMEVEFFDEVPRWMFYPQPKVDSVVVRLGPKKAPPLKLKDEDIFPQIVQSLFRQRNRKVRNAILPFLKGMRHTPAEEALKLAGIIPFHDKRPRELRPEDFGAVANALPD
jgi:16S rRNA (adenine1518-N6/adenine1519-N6)-dimethyltransferase